MSLLGIDVGTTGCKVAAFSADGAVIASAYVEYDAQHPQPGWAELDSAGVWEQIKRALAQVAAGCSSDPVRALAVSSLAEAMVPVTPGREILGPSLLNFDVRGEEFLAPLRRRLDDRRLYQINGNPLGNNYGLTKLLWIQAHQPDLYARADKFLLWGSFVPFMLGSDAVVDYSLANRMLLFDLERGAWSQELLELTGLDEAKLARLAPAGAVVGTVSGRIAAEVGLPPGVLIVSGAHDQCASAVGCGVLDSGLAMFGLGTFLCIVPVFEARPAPEMMLGRGLNTQHHAVPDRYVCFIYNQGGSCVKWYRDTFAAERRQETDIYTRLFAEVPPGASRVLAFPDFTRGRGSLAGLNLETTRGEILKGIVEGTTFDLKEKVEMLPAIGVSITDFRATGGGSRSDAWVQTCADILERPIVRPRVTEAGALGAAILAGVGSGEFPNVAAGVEAMVRLERTFEPQANYRTLYRTRFEDYKAFKARVQP